MVVGKIAGRIWFSAATSEVGEAEKLTPSEEAPAAEEAVDAGKEATAS